MAKTRKIQSARKKKDSTQSIVSAAVKGIQEKKGHDIITLDLRKTGSSEADFYIVCHGDSKPQVEAIAKSVEETVYKKCKEETIHREGFENAEWILLDYFNVIVHVFRKEQRLFYGIERLWADADIKKVANQ